MYFRNVFSPSLRKMMIGLVNHSRNKLILCFMVKHSITMLKIDVCFFPSIKNTQSWRTLHYGLRQQTNTPLKHSFCWICPWRPSQSWLPAGPPWPPGRSDWSCSAREGKKTAAHQKPTAPHSKKQAELRTKATAVSVSWRPEGCLLRPSSQSCYTQPASGYRFIYSLRYETWCVNNMYWNFKIKRQWLLLNVTWAGTFRCQSFWSMQDKHFLLRRVFVVPRPPSLQTLGLCGTSTILRGEPSTSGPSFSCKKGKRHMSSSEQSHGELYTQILKRENIIISHLPDFLAVLRHFCFVENSGFF